MSSPDILKYESAAIKIQQSYKNFRLIKILRGIFQIYKEVYFKKLFPPINNPTTARLTRWEEAGGFTEESRIGAKRFQNQIGYFFEDIWNLSKKYKKLLIDGQNGGNDGISDKCLYEAKSRYDTMKGSLAFEEIKKKLEYAIDNDKDFRLFVLVDKDDMNRIMALHKGQALSKIKDIEGYDENKHLWVSGDEVFRYLFHSDYLDIQRYIISLLKFTTPIH